MDDDSSSGVSFANDDDDDDGSWNDTDRISFVEFAYVIWDQQQQYRCERR